ncbi:MAG: hypothetical protein U0871_12010 [Gemmataceae bacterium]
MTAVELETAVEQLVDGASLARVVEALQAVCYAKEEHLSATWQDARSAKVWLRAARALDHCRGFEV